jgi:acyl-CoA reductase-like NAD-dependent aldehyde dehydrogenase
MSIMSTKVENVAQWATTASAGDYLAYYSQMTTEETRPGYWTVTGDASGEVIWEGEAASSDEAYEAAERANERQSLCGFSEMVLDEAKRVLRRGDLTIAADDMGLRVVAREPA